MEEIGLILAPTWQKFKKLNKLALVRLACFAVFANAAVPAQLVLFQV
jgi:hypothetical protein